MSDWKNGGAAYLPTINALEYQLGIPENLLARVAFQECSWRTEVITGQIRSPAGAVGMFQLMPRFFPNAGVSWVADAHTAGSYLASLFRRFSTWPMALGAYNWGPGNIERYVTDEGDVTLPTETAKYILQITTDVSVNV